MKNLYLTLSLILFSVFGYAQYGPVPYRTLEQTVGENYIILPQGKINSEYNITRGEDPSSNKRLSFKEGGGKTVKLVSLFDYAGSSTAEKYGKFVDSTGKYFISPASEGCFLYLAPSAELQMARKALLNTTLWLKNGEISNENGMTIQGLRSKPLTVIDVKLSTNAYFPQLLTVKTETGIIGFIKVNASGTNLDSENPRQFYNLFYSESPQVTADREAAIKESAAKESAKQIEAAKIAKAAAEVEAAKKAEEIRNNPCPLIEYKFDKFEQEKKYSTPLMGMNNCDFIKVITKTGATTYYLSLSAIGVNAMTTQKGVIIILKNGKRISKPNAEVETRVNSRAEFERSAFISLTAADLALFKTSPIEGYKLYVDEKSPKEPEILHKMFQCLLTKN